MARIEAPIAKLSAEAYKIPTDAPEADGTLTWNATTLIIVTIDAGNMTGLGYTYADACLVPLIQHILQDVVVGQDAMNIGLIDQHLWKQVRNLGRSGLAACAISAIDTALWDLKARLLDQPLAVLLGQRRHKIAVYGSGGFTSYDDGQLREQLSGWVQQDGCEAVKIKIGSNAQDDPRRVTIAKHAIGNAKLFVDANGAYHFKQAASLAQRFVDDADICWFEEPLSSDDTAGLALLRGALPVSVDQAAGEYISTLDDARILLQANAVDVLQADVTRCGGITGFLQIAALCEAHHIDLSGHCAPAVHLAVACSAPRLRHLEWFHDHVRIEHELFAGAPRCQNGTIAPDLTQPGHGLHFKRSDAEQYRVA